MKKGLKILCAALSLTAIMSFSAFAAETRKEYRAEAEPIRTEMKAMEEQMDALRESNKNSMEHFKNIHLNKKETAGRKPAIMARIVCMPEFVKTIRLAENCPQDEVTVEIGINDLFVPQNQGAWLWQLTKEGSRMIQESRFIAKGKMEVLTISELTEWLFGYRTPAQVAKIPYGEYIKPFHGVFLDEVV